MRRKKGMGELELAVQRVIWERKEASVRDVQVSLGDGYAYTTLLTIVQRLYSKGILNRKKIGRSFVYSPTKKRDSVLERLKKGLFGGRSIELISYLLESDEEISQEDLKAIEKLIQERQK